MLMKNDVENIRFKMSKNTTMKKLYSAIENKYVDEMLVPFLKKFTKYKSIKKFVLQ